MSNRNLKVLIVDDEAPARDRLSRLLRDLSGYEEVGHGSTGKEAVELAASKGADYRVAGYIECPTWTALKLPCI